MIKPIITLKQTKIYAFTTKALIADRKVTGFGTFLSISNAKINKCLRQLSGNL